MMAVTDHARLFDAPCARGPTQFSSIATAGSGHSPEHRPRCSGSRCPPTALAIADDAIE
jgi:hypothetical protein